MNAPPSGFGVLTEWQDPRPPLPWRGWLIGLGLFALFGVLTMVVATRLFGPAPTAPLPQRERAAQEIAGLVEEARGAESLYVMLENAPERRAMQVRLMAQRARLATLVATLKAGGAAAPDPQRAAELTEALNAWWAVQDEVFETLQPQIVTRDGASRARLLVTVDSQRSYQRLLNIIDRWVAQHER
jgi:hypothetical protein